MEVQLNPEQEAQLAQIASKTGTNTERLVKDFVLRLLESETRFHPSAPEVSVLHFGAMKPLHRHDIYDNGR